MANPLASLSQDLVQLAAKAAEAVVAVQARPRFSSSGIHWRANVVVTASHTVRQEEGIMVADARGRTMPATLAGREPGLDLAVLKVAGADLALPAAANAAPQVGAFVLAVGRSAALGLHAEWGVVSSVAGPGRTWRGSRLDAWIRLDLAFYPTTDGSAVVDAEGRLLGLATSALSRHGGVVIPAATIDRVVGEILGHGHVRRGFLGVGMQALRLSPAMVEQLRLPQSQGVSVISLEPEGPAARAGLWTGDILLSLAGQPLASPEDVHPLLESDAVGKTIEARALRGESVKQFRITVGERPAAGR